MIVPAAGSSESSAWSVHVMVVVPAEAPGASIAAGDRSEVPASPAPAPVVVQYAAAGPAPHTSAPASSAASAKARRRRRDIGC